MSTSGVSRARRGAASGAAPRSEFLALAAACGAGFLVFLDTTIVNVAFPDLRLDFRGAGPDELVWILDGYFIAVAAFLVFAGGVADWFGRRRTLLIGLAAFGLSSVLCAAADSWQMLTAARVVQGVAGAALVPSSVALLLELFPHERRAAGIGLWGAAAALAAAAGPVLGGALTEYAGWRWIFLVNVPIVAALLWAGTRALEESRDAAARGLPEWLGSCLVAVALGLLALGVVRGNDWGWGAPATLVTFAVALLAAGAAAARSLRHERPAVDPALFRVPSFTIGTVATALFAVGLFAMVLANILFLTTVWQYSVLHAGLAVAPGSVASAIVAAPAGRVADRFGHRAVIVPGAALYAAGIVLLSAAPAPGDYLADWLPGQVLSGAGIGLAFPALGAAAAADVPGRQYARAVAVTSAARQIGAVLGTAVVVAFVGAATGRGELMSAFDRAYLFAAIAVVLAGATSLALTPRRGPDPGDENDDHRRRTLVRRHGPTPGRRRRELGHRAGGGPHR